MLKILVFAPDYHPTAGGYANGITNMTRWLAGAGGCAVTVLTPKQLSGARELAAENLAIHRLPAYPEILRGLNRLVYNRRLDVFFRDFFARHSFDFLLIETFELPAISARLASRCGLPPGKMAVRIHGCTETEIYASARTLEHKLQFAQAKRLARRIPNIFSTTQYYIDFFKKHYCGGDIYLADKNYAVLPTFPAYRTQEQTETPSKMLDELQKKGFACFLTLGRMDSVGYLQKNFELLAFALKRLETKNNAVFKTIRVLLRGTGDYKPKFEEMLSRLGIRDSFIMLDYLSDGEMRALQRGVRATVLVSRFEGHSMFAAEALEQGSPLIVSRNTGVSPLVADGENGYLVSADSPLELAAALGKIVSADTSYMRRKSLEIFRNNFSGEVLLDKFAYYLEVFPHSLKCR